MCPPLDLFLLARGIRPSLLVAVCAMAKFLRKLLGGNTTLGVSRSLLFNCKEHAAKEEWFNVSKGWIGTDFRSRHSILMVHVWLVHRRLVQCKRPESKRGLSIQESLFDELWDDTSVRVRAAGINELSVNKYLTQVQGYSFKTCVELDEAMERGSDTEKLEEVAGTLWRTVYNKRDEVDEERVLSLAKYVQNEHASLQALTDEAVLEARVQFSPVPHFDPPTKAQLLHGGGAVEPPRPLASSIDELIAKGGGPEEWQVARAANGRQYYFNVKTRDTRWEAP